MISPYTGQDNSQVLEFLIISQFQLLVSKLWSCLKNRLKIVILHSSVLLWVLIPNHPNVQIYFETCIFAWKPTPSNQTSIHDFLNTGCGWQLGLRIKIDHWCSQQVSNNFCRFSCICSMSIYSDYESAILFLNSLFKKRKRKGWKIDEILENVS